MNKKNKDLLISALDHYSLGDLQSISDLQNVNTKISNNKKELINIIVDDYFHLKDSDTFVNTNSSKFITICDNLISIEEVIEF